VSIEKYITAYVFQIILTFFVFGIITRFILLNLKTRNTGFVKMSFISLIIIIVLIFGSLIFNKSALDVMNGYPNMKERNFYGAINNYEKSNTISSRFQDFFAAMAYEEIVEDVNKPEFVVEEGYFSKKELPIFLEYLHKNDINIKCVRLYYTRSKTDEETFYLKDGTRIDSCVNEYAKKEAEKVVEQNSKLKTYIDLLTSKLNGYEQKYIDNLVNQLNDYDTTLYRDLNTLNEKLSKPPQSYRIAETDEKAIDSELNEMRKVSKDLKENIDKKSINYKNAVTVATKLENIKNNIEAKTKKLNDDANQLNNDLNELESYFELLKTKEKNYNDIKEKMPGFSHRSPMDGMTVSGIQNSYQTDLDHLKLQMGFILEREMEANKLANEYYNEAIDTVSKMK
jgi:hypothetical protein